MSCFRMACLVIGVMLLGLPACRRDPRVPKAAVPASIVAALSAGASEGFARVLGPRPFEFPKDHGPHLDHQIEWWYFTGNLATAEGARFGFQLTFFRTGHRPSPSDRDSPFAATSSWMAHFALTDVGAARFTASDRFARGAAGLAGAEAEPFRVWTESWSAASTRNELFPLRLRARADAVAIDLELRAEKPLVLNGDRGFSRKAAEPGNASCYLTFPRLAARGTIESGGVAHEASGLAWIDHEWSTSVLSPELAGWDWFSLQFDDGRDLMVYRLRRRDGTTSPFSGGTLVEVDGRARSLRAGEVEVTPRETWTSRESGIRYPVRWRLSVPSAGIEVDLDPVLEDQELRLAVTYWEGAVVARGPGTAVLGRGYVELVGYAEAALR